jgi:hypothetical protein
MNIGDLVRHKYNANTVGVYLGNRNVNGIVYANFFCFVFGGGSCWKYLPILHQNLCLFSAETN